LLAGLDAAGRTAPACVIGGERVDRWRMKIVPPSRGAPRALID
jgi:hypothetical protein